ncbi:DUF1638 domain-containing protein [Ruminiclostridium papyrosolvens]|uniref:DUF1638 domain-containing protein n=1 Tax=Ruminiclostridium papyrosolvens C7 TaxID=1330534 RepID=U4R2X2_9FIRM|nr:DUF1638 domain-containing protein [Ruminiclostridium papyrosolvens]EPR12571.1 hypothetical protein L323_07825 [Ruminiclostridium papyrosolvens C7]
MLRLKIIACDVLNREISYLASQSEHFTDVTFVHQGLHDTPEKLNKRLQYEIDRANEGFPYNYFDTCPDYDYIIVCYGLCSNGITGISSRRLPMVVPKAHDCITLLLGSKERYMDLFRQQPGTYWFSTGWIERGWQPGELKYTTLQREYIQKYGEENAEYLMEMEQSWMKEYNNAGFISWSSFKNNEFYRSAARSAADFLNWDFFEVPGNPDLLKNMLNGRFNENEVLIVPPGAKIAASNDNDIITVEGDNQDV